MRMRIWFKLPGRIPEMRPLSRIRPEQLLLLALVGWWAANVREERGKRVTGLLPAAEEDWERMREAIEWKLQHLEALVGWWGATVQPRGPHHVTDRLHVEDAERTTGFTKMQVSRIRSRAFASTLILLWFLRYGSATKLNFFLINQPCNYKAEIPYGAAAYSNRRYFR